MATAYCRTVDEALFGLSVRRYAALIDLSSMPQCIGGTRNWDYHYYWIRGAAYAVFARRRVGLPS
ncbi:MULTISPECIES: hypothetical protein [unclassified Streptomyces]|uniref:hypothetical protein n=1 Tax=unclassified Streptomyces TaxID=2593676 RepID=UPI00332B812E